MLSSLIKISKYLHRKQNSVWKWKCIYDGIFFFFLNFITLNLQMYSCRVQVITHTHTKISTCKVHCSFMKSLKAKVSASILRWTSVKTIFKNSETFFPCPFPKKKDYSNLPPPSKYSLTCLIVVKKEFSILSFCNCLFWRKANKNFQSNSSRRPLASPPPPPPNTQTECVHFVIAVFFCFF